MEAELERAAKEAQDEKMANGEDEDHTIESSRRLTDAFGDENKEEGQNFQGGVWRTAAARYHKALTHCSKFLI